VGAEVVATIPAQQEVHVTTFRYRSSDLDLFPDDGKRREIIDGALYVSKQPTSKHQYICMAMGAGLFNWNSATNAGVVEAAPGIVFADDDDVAPDLIWISHERYAQAIADDGHFHAAPELVVEVLSPGAANARRDRVAKLDLYSRRGVQEYWIVDWEHRQIEVYRRADAALHLIATLVNGDLLESPLLPGFSLDLEALFSRLPAR
jgi:Uma2 family endonuclease